MYLMLCVFFKSLTICISKRVEKTRKMCWDSGDWQNLQAQGIQLSLLAPGWQKWHVSTKKPNEAQSPHCQQRTGFPGSLSRTFCEVLWINLDIVHILWMIFLTLKSASSSLRMNLIDPLPLAQRTKGSLTTTWSLTSSYHGSFWVWPAGDQMLQGHCWLCPLPTKGQGEAKGLDLRIDTALEEYTDYWAF